MEVMFFMIPVVVIFAVGALIAFIWAAKSGQFEDTQTPAHRVLFEDIDVVDNKKGKDDE